MTDPLTVLRAALTDNGDTDPDEFQVDDALAQVETLIQALGMIAAQQPKTIDWLRANGIIFDGPLGTDPDNWEHVAFSIYTDLCEVDTIAREALAPFTNNTP